MITAISAEEMMTRLGYEVCGIATTGPKAVAMAEKTRPDLVLMDIRLAHGTDGIAAAREIRDRFGIPSIFVTAHSDPETRQRADQADHVGFLAKPYSSDVLEAALGKACERLMPARITAA